MQCLVGLSTHRGAAPLTLEGYERRHLVKVCLDSICWFMSGFNHMKKASKPKLSLISKFRFILIKKYHTICKLKLKVKTQFENNKYDFNQPFLLKFLGKPSFIFLREFWDFEVFATRCLFLFNSNLVKNAIQLLFDLEFLCSYIMGCIQKEKVLCFLNWKQIAS